MAVAVAVCVGVGLAAAPGGAGVQAGNRVVIRDTGVDGVFHGKFALAVNGVTFDTGNGLITPVVGNTIVRDGESQEPVSGSEIFTGKKGTLRIHFEGVAIEVGNNKYAEYGSWKIEQLNASGVYKTWMGGGRWANAEVNGHYSIEWAGVVRR